MPKASFLFVPYRTGPQSQADAKLANSDARSHAAAVSRQRRDNKVRLKLGWQPSLHPTPASNDQSPDSRRNSKDSEATDIDQSESSDVLHILDDCLKPGTARAHRRQHMRAMQFSWRAGNVNGDPKLSPSLSLAPVASLQGDTYAQAVVDYFRHAIAPIYHPMYAIFDVTNVFTSYWFELMSHDEYTNAGLAMVGAIMERLSNPSTTQSDNNKAYQAKALARLRKKYAESAHNGRNAADDITIIVVLAFANLARFLGDTESYKTHRRNMQEMVKSRGGLDQLGDQGLVKCALMQYDTFWIFEPNGTALFPDARPEHIPVYPAFPLSSDLREVFVKLPVGFQSLILKGKISVELIDVLGRAAEASVNGISSITTGDIYNSPIRKNHDFLEACPTLRLPDDARNIIEKKICLALLMYCANTFTQARSSTSVYLASRTELTRLLSQSMESLLLPQEDECLFWVCVICVDSWRKDGPLSPLLPQGLNLLPHLKHMGTGLLPQNVLQKFFFNEELLDGCTRYLGMAG